MATCVLFIPFLSLVNNHESWVIEGRECISAESPLGSRLFGLSLGPTRANKTVPVPAL